MEQSSGPPGLESAAAITSGASTSTASRHALNHTWTLFLLQDADRCTHSSWRLNQVPVFQFSTVEDFWCMVNYMHPLSNIGYSDYSLFRESLEPAWEDPRISQGGRWVAKLPPKLPCLDDVWLTITMAIIGETLDSVNSEAICGAVVAVRARSLKLSLWLRSRDETVACSIGREFQRLITLHLDPKDRKSLDVSFQSFTDNIEYSLQRESSPAHHHPSAGIQSGHLDKAAVSSTNAAGPEHERPAAMT